MASPLVKGEAQDAIETGTPVYQGRRWSALEAKQIDPETTGGGWRQNDWKVKQSKQGTPPRAYLVTYKREQPPPEGQARLDVYRVGGQSTRMSFETANPRGAKGCRKIDREKPNHWKPHLT